LSKRPGKEYSDYVIFGQEVTVRGMFYIYLLFFGGIILGTGIPFFLKRVYSIKKDIQNGFKEPVSYKITRKLNFPMTSQYFFSFNDPKFDHYEVDQETYFAYNEGDQFLLYRTVHSKYVFTRNGKFTFL
jgi:hypothetical protein